MDCEIGLSFLFANFCHDAALEDWIANFSSRRASFFSLRYFLRCLSSIGGAVGGCEDEVGGGGGGGDAGGCGARSDGRVGPNDGVEEISAGGGGGGGSDVEDEGGGGGAGWPEEGAGEGGW